MKRSIKMMILDILDFNDDGADFSTIFEYLVAENNDFELKAKDPQKSVRGVISQLKKEGKIIKEGTKFYRVDS